MSSTIHCLRCGATFVEPVGPCKHCGGPIEVSIPLTGIEVICSTGQVGIVVDNINPNGAQEIIYTAPAGSHSESSLVGSRFAAQIKPPIDVGRSGEPRVLACIMANLTKTGKEAVFLPACDHRGEDGVLQIDGYHVVVQIVTATPSASFWGEVAKGNKKIQEKLTAVAEWIHTAINEKARRYSKEDKLSMLLAVDVVHMGVLAGSQLGTQYKDSYGDPSVRFDFGAVWLIGPTENHVFKLGNSRW